MSAGWSWGVATGFALSSLFHWIQGTRQRQARLLAAARQREQQPLSTPQLLAWIDEATQGWLILKPDLSIAYINGKAERFIQTLKRRWAYRHAYPTSAMRADALRPWIKHYNHQRPHRSLGNRSPMARLREARAQRA